MRRPTIIAFALCLGACMSDDASKAPPPPVVATAPAAAPKKAALAKGEKDEAPPPMPPLRELDDAEVDRLRDPFEPQMIATSESGCVPDTKTKADRAASVAFGDVAVSTLRVRGTMTAGHEGSAIVTDGSRTQVVTVGMKVGLLTADRSGACREWRVDRVREGEVVLQESGGPLSAGAKTFVIGNARS